MTTQPRTQNRGKESGNVLFLILIAVALFAALSYAVTQSTRSGGGDASSEKSLVSSAALTQYPAAIKTSIVRMMVSNGVDANNLTFDGPSNFTALDDSTVPKTKKNNVFYPTVGGGATYQQAPADVMANGALGTWHFNGENEITNIGTNVASGTASSAATADVIAYLPGVTKAVCDKIHEQLGISSTYVTTTAIDVTDMNVADPNIDGTGKVIGGALAGQPQGCFNDSVSGYTYYSVLVER